MTTGLRARVEHLGDLAAGSDPGLSRLRMAASGAGAMASALGVEYLVASLRGAGSQDVLVAMLLGAIVAMMGSMGLGGFPTVSGKARVAVFFPVAIGLGMVPGIAVSGHTDLMLTVFVVVMFAAVFVRRFGMAFFFYGFMAWMGYFFSAFLGATWAMLPWLIADTAIGAAWVLLLSATLLRTNPRRTLDHVRRSFGARARALARACAELLTTDPADGRQLDRARRRVHAQQTRLGEAALMIEAWSGDDQALPPGWSPQALRRRVIDVQQCLDRVAGACNQLVGADGTLRERAVPVVRALAQRGYPGAGRAADELARAVERADPTTAGWGAAHHLALGARQYLDFVDEADSPPEVDGDVEFTPAVVLAMGNLPGTQAVARDVAVRGRRWNPLTRLDFTTRQAVQVAIAGALAIVFGRELDTTRYYWAVIAAFIAFTGTGTRSETFLKASNRVLGTLVGLFAGIGFANLTAGHTGWTLVVIVLAMFCGFYLIRLSYAYMIFFITIMVSQLYSVLNEFSDGLLVLRLEETAIGAAVGIGVALIVAPLSTRDTVATSQTNLLTALAELLDAAAGRAQELRSDGTAELDALERGLENRLRELVQVAAPLTRPLVWDNSPREARHRLTLYASCARTARSVAASVRLPAPTAGSSLDDGYAVARACRTLAGVSRGMAQQPGPLGSRLRERTAVAEDLVADDDSSLFGSTEQSPPAATSPSGRALTHLHMLLQELNEPRYAQPAGQARHADLTAAAAR